MLNQTYIFAHIYPNFFIIMDDGEGVLSFDFEGGLDTGPTQPTASVPATHSSADPITDSGPAANANNSSAAQVQVVQAADGLGGGRRSFRQTVCRHWLRSLCMKGDACGFLHQYDKSRMPICRFFRLYGECREQDCVYKHTNEDIKECNMYGYMQIFSVFFIFVGVCTCVRFLDDTTEQGSTFEALVL